MENQSVETALKPWTHDAYSVMPPPGWETLDPAAWGTERDRCATMYRMSRAHMPLIAEMFNVWRQAWTARVVAYDAAVKRRDTAAVAAVVRAVDVKTARSHYLDAREAQSYIDALVSAPWQGARIDAILVTAVKASKGET